MNAYMQKVDAVARKVVAWRKIGKNKDSYRGSLLMQVGLVCYKQELDIPNTTTFTSAVIGRIKELELEDDSSDPELPM